VGTAFRQDLPRGAQAPGVARAEVRSRLSGVLEPALLADVELLVSELATNGVRHGGQHGDAVRLELEVAPGERVHVRLCDSGPGFDEPPSGPRPDGSGGWGLVLVDELSTRWGVDRDGCFCVWFELDLAERRGMSPRPPGPRGTGIS